jgi:hypothetical protein
MTGVALQYNNVIDNGNRKLTNKTLENEKV